MTLIDAKSNEIAPAIAAELPPRVWGTSPFRDPAKADVAIKQMATYAREAL